MIPYKHGVIGSALIGGGSGEWERPADWLPIPTIAEDEQVVYFLFFVSQNSGANYMVFRFSGNYTVEWGDGNTENINGGTNAQHQFDWDDVGNEIEFEGITYRQAVIKITPQSGHDLTLMNFALNPSGFLSTTWRYTGVMEWHCSVPELSNISASQFVKHGGRWSNCRIINMKLLGASPRAEHTTGLFSTFPNVKIINIENNSSWLDCGSLFTDNYNLFKITASEQFTNATTFNAAHRSNTQLIDFSYYDAPVNTVMTNFAQNCYSVTKLELDIPGVTNASLITSGMVSLKEITLTNCGDVTNWTTTFTSTQLEKAILQGATRGFSVYANYLGETELNAMFDALGTASGSQTIDARFNPGSATCDTSIATAKGWTVTIA